MIQNVIQPKFGDGAVKEGVWKCDVCLLALWLLCSLNPLYPGQARTRALLCSACHLRIERKKASPFLHIPYATVGRKKSSPLCYHRCTWLCSPCCQSRSALLSSATVLHIAAAASSRSPLSPQLSSLSPRLTHLQSPPVHVTAVRRHYRHVKLHLGDT